jgi:hypothetical protein
MWRCKLVLLLLVVLLDGAFAEDIETLDHHVYKNAAITRAEPDGIVVSMKTGIIKIPFDNLPTEFKTRFGYDKEQAKAFAAKIAQDQQVIYDQTQAAKADANASVAEIAERAQAERAQKQALIREQAAREAENAQREASVKAAIQSGGIIPGMTGEECIRASGKPQFVKRTTDAAGQPAEEWYYGAGCVYFENGVVVRITNVVDGQDPRAAPQR